MQTITLSKRNLATGLFIPGKLVVAAFGGLKEPKQVPLRVTVDGKPTGEVNACTCLQNEYAKQAQHNGTYCNIIL